MDWAASPCDDFFQFSCGAWVANTEIPKDRGVWYLWSEIDERNLLMQKQILADTAAGKPPEGAAYSKELGDFWATCMDEPSLETALPKLKTQLERIRALKNPQAVAMEVAALHADGVGPLFEFGAQQDFQDANQEIAVFDQGGLGLPDRDYYLKDDDQKMKRVRELYQKHMVNVFVLLGDSQKVATERMEAVLKLETELAKVSMDKVTRRDPEKVYHRMDLASVQKLAPGYPWEKFLAALKAPKEVVINVTHPPFFTRVGELLAKTPLSTWKSYLEFHEVESLTAALPKRFVDEQFDFKSKALTGAKEDLPRWKKCVHLTDALMGEALARSFVAKLFGEDAKGQAREMVKDVEAAFDADLSGLGWMDAPSRTEALNKLHQIGNKVGYPDKWKTYDGLKTGRKSFLENLRSAMAYEEARDVRKMGKPVDRSEWQMTPLTVNAYYDSSMNEIALPMGILQAPLFDKDYSPSFNFGSTGASTVGHELTHGFDDEGRHFDAKGTLRDWWSPGASKAFTERTSCVADQFDRYVVADDVHVNGKLTLGENVADLGGLKLGYAAFQKYRRDHPDAPGAFRLTPEQSFFVGYAQSWCAKVRTETALVKNASDPHAPPHFRVNGPMSNLQAFQQAFSCRAGDRMVSGHPCEVW
jgi:endothelin-converting enzyme/putative endopeptidase